MPLQPDFPQIFASESFDSFTYPLINESAIPYAYSLVSLSKRVRLSGNDSSHIDTTRTTELQTLNVNSASPLRVDFAARLANNPSTEPIPEQPSVPPRGRSSKAKQEPSVLKSGTIIQETFSFPTKQTWLTPKPRNRQGPLPAEVSLSSDKTGLSGDEVHRPQDGTLVLGKDTDKIAALIAQKRKDNEAQLFRERMFQRQRLYQGTNSQDRLIAASHEELKRRMEMGARGIFEQKEDRLDAPASTLTTRDDKSYRNESSAESDEDSTIDVSQNADPLEITSSTTKRTRGLHEWGLDVQNSFDPPEAGVTTRVVAPNTVTHSAYPPTQAFLAQPRFANNALRNLYIDDNTMRAPITKHQTSRTWQAFPQDTTVAIQAPPVVPSIHTPAPNVSYESQQITQPEKPMYEQHDDRVNEVDVAYLDQSYHSDSMVLRSNVNMFTKQARENGVIGGNNNWLEGEGEKRKNMFSNRS